MPARSVAQKSVIQRIADEVGTSYRTVARVLGGGNKEVWPSIAKRAEAIRAVARRLNYLPNSAARAVSTGRFGAVAVLLGREAPAHLPAGMLFGAEEELSARGLAFSLARLPDERLVDEGFMPGALQRWSVDGLLVHYIHSFPEAFLDLLGRYRLPSIWLNTKLEHDCAHPDDRGGARAATRRLLELGHERIAICSYANTGHYSEADRRRGYAEAMKRAGLTPIDWPQGGGSVPVAERLDASVALLSSRPRPTALIAYSAHEAVPLMMAAARLGIEVPSQLSVIVFQPTKRSAPGLEISTMVVPTNDLGREGVRMLLEKIEHPRRKLAPRTIPYGPPVGPTCARAPG